LEQQKWPPTSTTKATIRGKWLTCTWTNFPQSIQNCYQTVPNP